MKLLAIPLLCLAFATSALAADSDTAYTNAKVSKVYVYAEFGGGDLVILPVGTLPSACSAGFFISPTHGGFKTVYAAVMLAKTNDTALNFYADSAKRWAGSSQNYCQLNSVRIE